MVAILCNQTLLAMKKFVLLPALLIMLSLGSCYVGDDDGIPGPVGPQGPQGPQGPEGAPGESGYVFEYTDINFTAPDYKVLLSYPEDFEGYDSDVALVYLLWEVDEDGNEIWRALPQTIITENGMLQYNFDFTKFDVELFLDAQFPLDNLTASDTDEWIARVVVVPGEFWDTGGRLNVADYNEVKAVLGLPELGDNRSTLKRR